jgi:tetratricopeptide (TPR) repeat protein
MTSSRLPLTCLLLLASLALAQTSNPPSGAQGSNAQGTAQTSGQQSASPQPSPTNPKGKHPPTAKNKQEFDQYQAVANATDPLAAEKLAREFEVQFPQSELLPMIYLQVMTKYQKADNADKTLEMGHKVLQYDPDNINALLLNATVLVERTRETDIDRDQRLNEATADAQRALEDIQTGNYMVAPTATPQQVQQFKDQVTHMAYSAIGTADLIRKNDAAAEQNFRKATATQTGKGDPVVWYRLALALDHQQKYPDAKAANTTALSLAPADSAVGNMAKSEQNRLNQLAAGGAAASRPPASNQPQPEVVQPK